MRRTLNRVIGLLTPALLLSLGCGGLNVERTYDLEPGTSQQVEISPVKSDQTVTVAVKSEGGEVNVYVVLEKDMEKAKDAIKGGKNPPDVVISKEGVTDATLDATIPSNNAYTVILYNPLKSSRKAHVEVKIKGK